MKIFNYKINSSVIISSVIAMLIGATDLLTSGQVIGTVADVAAEIITYFVGHQENFKPYLDERIYQLMITFAPVLMIILRTTNLKYKPPIEKIDGKFQAH